MNHAAGQDSKLVTAALTLAERHGWNGVTPARLARATRLPPSIAAAFLADPTQTMRAIADAMTAAAIGEYRHDAGNSPRERLFELMMGRFDRLQRHRGGILALQRTARNDPRLLAAIVQAIYPQFTTLLQTARIKSEPPRRQLIAAALVAMHGVTFCVWQQDDSADMARTMAALDRQLKRAEALMNLLDRQTG